METERLIKKIEDAIESLKGQKQYLESSMKKVDEDLEFLQVILEHQTTRLEVVK